LRTSFIEQLCLYQCTLLTSSIPCLNRV